MVSNKNFLSMIQAADEDCFAYLNELFEECPETIMNNIQYRKIPKGQTFICAGEACRYIYIILKGYARGIDFQNLDKAYVFVQYSAKHFLGEIEVMSDFRKHAVSLEAATECEVLMINSSDYMDWMKQDVHALLMRTQDLIKYLSSENAVGRKYMLVGCKDRLILFLTNLYKKHQGNEMFYVKRTQTELAERVGCNLRSVQRNLKQMKEEGFIFIDGGKIRFSAEQYEKMLNYLCER